MLEGSIVALVTPMGDDGEVDYKTLQELIDWHITSGTQGIVAVGTSGESATLSVEEHIQVVKAIVEFTAGRIPVYAGTGANATHEAITLTNSVTGIGVAACLSVTPYYNKPTQKGLVQHFRTIADNTDLPIILYNVPGRTACDMLPEVTAELSEHPHIIGIKDATGNMERVEQLKTMCRDDFRLLSGDDATSLEFLRRGGHGVISVTNNVAPKLMAMFCQAAKAGDWSVAEQLNQQLMGLHTKLFLEANPIPVKWALWRIGKISNPGLRLPLTTLSDEYHAAVEAALVSAELL